MSEVAHSEIIYTVLIFGSVPVAMVVSEAIRHYRWLQRLRRWRIADTPFLPDNSMKRKTSKLGNHDSQRSAISALDEQTVIAECAYHLWVSKGCPEGSAEADWLEAEKHLRGNSGELRVQPQGQKRGALQAIGASRS